MLIRKINNVRKIGDTKCGGRGLVRIGHSLTSSGRCMPVTRTPDYTTASTQGCNYHPGIRSSTQFEVTSNIKQFISDKLLIKTQKEGANAGPLAFCNLSQLESRHKLWTEHLPRVRPFYAVKCNSDPVLLKCLADLGTGFDCASQVEMEAALRAGASPKDIIFANPCKFEIHIKYAAAKGISLMTFDNESELHKIASLYPSAQLVIRIRADAKKATYKLGAKFGCSVPESLQLLRTAQELGLSVVGVSFHVGTDCQSSDAYSVAIHLSHQVFQHAQQFGFNFSLLDIGGGFPGLEVNNGFFITASDSINKTIKDLFTQHPKLTVIAEPGKFIACSWLTLCTQIISKRNLAGKNITMYYINDGVFGTLNGVLFEEILKPHPLKDTESAELFPCNIWGPTCDGYDKIGMYHLPEMNVGDYILFYNMGAYSVATSSVFNGFGQPEIIYYRTD